MIELPGASPLLCELASRGVRFTYRKGRRLIAEGQNGDTLYIILSGKLRAYSEDPVKDREITFGTYGPGEYVGEMSLDGGPRSASVMVEERSDCALVSRATLMDFIGERPAFAFELLSKVIGRARAATLSARQMALNDSYGQLKHVLDSMAVKGEDGTRVIADPPTHLALSRQIGRTRPMVTRLLGDLMRSGHLQCTPDAWILSRELPARW